MRKYFLTFMMLVPAQVFAQRNYTLQIIPADKDTAFLTRDYSYHRSFPDTVTLHAEMKNLISRLYAQGFLEATFQNFQRDSLQWKAVLLIGKRWEWASLSNGNIDDVILNRIGFKERLYDHKPFLPDQISKLREAILGYCENNGYPFAVIKLDSINANNQQLAAKIFLQKNRLITLDSISIKGDIKIANAYLANYLGFRFPSVYREDLIKKISTKIRELPFCSEARAPQVTFIGDHAVITLFLKKKSASRFDFVLGILPNSNSTGKLLINGDGQLNLVNPFGRGESVFINFSQLQSRTTLAELRADYPYIFNLPFGIDANFSLYKNDSLYIDVKEQIGVKYLFTGVNYLKLFFQNAATSVLSFDSLQIIHSKQLPSYLDLRTKFYGVEYKYEKLDYRFNPRRGWNFLLSGEAGNRKVKKNAGIVQLHDPNDSAFDFSSLYDSVAVKETQYIFRGEIDRFFQLSTRSAFQLSYRGAAIISKKVFQNELFRIGGFHLLRGFNEQSIFASQYHIGTAEYHYLLGQNSFFYLFADGAYVENTSASIATYDTPFGFGAGINFETRAGIFGVNYALGSQQNNPLEFRNAKIHFGYVNYF